MRNEASDQHFNTGILRSYLRRLGIHSAPAPDFVTLNSLHHQHLLRVPFENLDIHLGKRIVLSESAILDKLLRQGRGGFCYELNYGFAYLLRQIGFSVDLLSARVFNGQSYDPEFDHMLLLVRHRDQAWIADVGFGECFRTPLTLDGAVVSENGVAYKIVLEADGQYILLESKQDKHWKPQSQFRLTPHNLSDFDAMRAYQQNSPLSHFTQKSLYSIATNDGRLTIFNGLFISTKPGSAPSRRFPLPTRYVSNCSSNLASS